MQGQIFRTPSCSVKMRYRSGSNDATTLADISELIRSCLTKQRQISLHPHKDNALMNVQAVNIKSKYFHES